MRITIIWTCIVLFNTFIQVIRARKVARLDKATNACGKKAEKSNVNRDKTSMLDNSNNMILTKDSMELENFQELPMQDLIEGFQDTPKLEDDGLPQLDHVTSIETNDMPIEEMFDLDEIDGCTR